MLLLYDQNFLDFSVLSIQIKFLKKKKTKLCRFTIGAFNSRWLVLKYLNRKMKVKVIKNHSQKKTRLKTNHKTKIAAPWAVFLKTTFNFTIQLLNESKYL